MEELLDEVTNNGNKVINNEDEEQSYQTEKEDQEMEEIFWKLDN